MDIPGAQARQDYAKFETKTKKQIEYEIHRDYAPMVYAEAPKEEFVGNEPKYRKLQKVNREKIKCYN